MEETETEGEGGQVRQEDRETSVGERLTSTGCLQYPI